MGRFWLCCCPGDDIGTGDENDTNDAQRQRVSMVNGDLKTDVAVLVKSKGTVNGDHTSTSPNRIAKNQVGGDHDSHEPEETAKPISDQGTYSDLIFLQSSLSIDNDDSSLEDNEVFDLHSPTPRPKKKFLEAAMAAKSISDINYIHVAKTPDEEGSSNSLDGLELFREDPPVPPPRKQFLEAAIMAKSLSDLNYAYSAPAPRARRHSMIDLRYRDDVSLEDSQLFDLNSSIPRPKKQFLEAALTAKSISDLNYFVEQAPKESTNQDSDGDGAISDSSLEDFVLFDEHPLSPHPKKQFLEAAMMAKSLSDLNYVHSASTKATRRKSMNDLTHEDDHSLGDNEVFDPDGSIPRPKKQFLEAALTAKSISDLNFVHTAQSLDDSIHLDYNASNESLDEDLFEDDSPNLHPKKQFLEAALTAKSLSDLNYVHTDGDIKESRWKSMSDLKYDDDSSLRDDEVFELEGSIPRPKKQFLEAALTAKSLSDLNFFAAQTPDTSIHPDYDVSAGSMEDFDLFENARHPRPKKQFLEAAMMAKSLSDLNYVHSSQEPRPSRRKSMTDFNDDDSLGDDELFELHASVPRPKKQFLEAALMAKSLSDLKFMHLNMTTVSSLNDNESRDDLPSNIVPEHLLTLSQPNLNFHPSDIHSIDNEDLFETVPQDPPIVRPVLKAALEAKAQLAEGIVIVNSRDEPNHSNDDEHKETVPEHLVIANQPATVHSHDDYSIEVEDIFEQHHGDKSPQKPLLKAALEAHAQRQEGFAKSLSALDAQDFIANSPSSKNQDYSKSVPDHLAIANQPSAELFTLDELSIDNDRLFDTPKQDRKNHFLMAALKAKEETNQIPFPISTNDLARLREIEQMRGGERGENQQDDGGLESSLQITSESA